MLLSILAVILNHWVVSERLIQLCDKDTSRSIADEGWEYFMKLGLAPTIYNIHPVNLKKLPRA